MLFRSRVKIMDFGIARLMTDGHLTRTGTKMGTIMYMSPEQVLALKDIDHRSDVYSLGVVFYEMLCGKTAYQVDTDSDFLVQRAIVDTPIPDPREIYAHISDESVKVLTGMTMKDREARIGLKEASSLLHAEIGFTAFETKQHKIPLSQQDIKTQDHHDPDIDVIIAELTGSRRDMYVKNLPYILLVLTLLEHVILWVGLDDWDWIDGFFFTYVVFSCLSVMQYITTIIQLKRIPSYYAVWLSVVTYLLPTIVSGWLYALWSDDHVSLVPSFIFLGLQAVMAFFVFTTYTKRIGPVEDDDIMNQYKRLKIISYPLTIISLLWAVILIIAADV